MGFYEVGYGRIEVRAWRASLRVREGFETGLVFGWLFVPGPPPLGTLSPPSTPII